MNSYLLFLLIAASAAFGFLLRVAIERRKGLAAAARQLLLKGRLSDCESQLDDALQTLSGREQALQFANAEVGRLTTAVEVAHNELRRHREFSAERLRLLEQTNNEYSNRFESISARVFSSSQQQIADLADTRIGAILNPLREQLGDFKKRVEDTYDRDSRDRMTLKAEIAQLKSLNERISDDAINLTNALRGDNKTLGNWGELVLERVLESAGLRKGVEYDRECSFSDEEGARRRPDVVLYLPGKRHIIVDSKVSIKAFERSIAEPDGAKKSRWLQQHAKALRKHVVGLSNKEYESIAALNTLDFVVMFIPVEAAFMAALEADESLYMDAFERDVLLVGPGSLMVTCRTIQNIWRTDRQNKNARQLARKAGEMVDKFALFSDELNKVGAALAHAGNAFESAQLKLTSGRGNLQSRAEELRRLGARSKRAVL